MASKDFVLDNGQTVRIFKRRGSRSLRLSVTAKNEVRLTIPAWTPYKVGLEFAKSRTEWILKHQKPTADLRDGQPIGKNHHIYFETRPGLAKPASRVTDTAIIIALPKNHDVASPMVQKIAEKACLRALKKQANHLLRVRLSELAQKHGFNYRSMKIKNLKSRWGSCDHQTNIVLNLFLMQLPWELIDYVLLHELAHTRVLKHGPDFWQELGDVLPSAKTLKKSLSTYQPVLTTGD